MQFSHAQDFNCRSSHIHLRLKASIPGVAGSGILELESPPNIDAHQTGSHFGASAPLQSSRSWDEIYTFHLPTVDSGRIVVLICCLLFMQSSVHH